MSVTSRVIIALLLLAAGLTAACGAPEGSGRYQGHAAEDSHGVHGGEGEHDASEEHKDLIALTPEQAAEAGVRVTVAERSNLSGQIELPAEIQFDQDRLAVVAAPVNGTITRLHAGEGDYVERGDVLATVSSRELAGMKADFLTARTREHLAQADLERERSLYEDQITSQSDLQAAEAAYAAARADRESAENKLHAIGIGHAELDRIEEAADGVLALTSVRAPLSGIIIERHATLGASVVAADNGGRSLFRIIDDSVVWADIAVYKTDAPFIREGLVADLVSNEGEVMVSGRIELILPVIDETSRTATARMYLENPNGMLRPGQFVTARIYLPSGSSGVAVPEKAIQTVEGRLSVFVPVDGGFEPQPVETGLSADGKTAITAGLKAGDAFVSEGAFTLKAQLEKDAFGDGHAH